MLELFSLAFFCLIASFCQLTIRPFCQQALELGLGGVVLKVEEAEAVIQLKVISFHGRDMGSLNCEALLLIMVNIIRSILTEGMNQAMC